MCMMDTMNCQQSMVLSCCFFQAAVVKNIMNINTHRFREFVGGIRS